jgi:ribosomal protein S18 acetylase RimI-like enzyme
MTVAYRHAGLADLDKIAPLFDAYRQFYGQGSDLPRARRWLEERMKRREAHVILAERDHHAVGFTLLYPSFSSVSTGHTLLLNDLFVAPEARRRGVATGLLDAALDLARELGALRVCLETARSNEIAQAVYRSAGWTADDTQWFHRAVAK